MVMARNSSAVEPQAELPQVRKSVGFSSQFGQLRTFVRQEKPGTRPGIPSRLHLVQAMLRLAMLPTPEVDLLLFILLSDAAGTGNPYRTSC
jgi:hypothetical protein